MLRHLLLALFLIGLSLPAISVSAHAETTRVDCHDMQPAQHKPDGDSGKTGHFCIGCVANPAMPVAQVPLSVSPASPIGRPMAALASTNARPGIPPPRL